MTSSLILAVVLTWEISIINTEFAHLNGIDIEFTYLHIFDPQNVKSFIRRDSLSFFFFLLSRSCEWTILSLFGPFGPSLNHWRMPTTSPLGAPSPILSPPSVTTWIPAATNHVVLRLWSSPRFVQPSSSRSTPPPTRLGLCRCAAYLGQCRLP